MATDSPPQGGRRHFHRGRRGHERRGGERRTPPSPNQPQPQREGHVDVEQIMRDIRAKIAQRHGIELTDQQVQELAARRLESILDPRTVKPALLDQLRRAAGAAPDAGAASSPLEPPFTFEDTTLYESPSGVLRFMRRLLNPVLKLFFDPSPLIHALHVQARLNAEATAREEERDRRQTEWNALHYELLQRVVTETAKVSLEAQHLSLQVESLSAKVDFNERRVRGIEAVVHQVRPAGQRDRERPPREAPPEPEPTAPAAAAAPVAPAEGSAGEPVLSDAPRRRRRRRRGRRGGVAGDMAPQSGVEAVASAVALEADEGDNEELETDTPESMTEAPPGPPVIATPEEIPDATAEPRAIAPPEPEPLSTAAEEAAPGDSAAGASEAPGFTTDAPVPERDPTDT